MDPIVEAIKAIAEQSLTNDRALLALLDAVTNRIIELERRVSELEEES